MRYFHAKSFAFVASIVGAAWMAGALCAPMAALATAMKSQGRQRRRRRRVVVVVANSRGCRTHRTRCDAGRPVPAEENSVQSRARKKGFGDGRDDKDCVFDLHGVYAGRVDHRVRTRRSILCKEPERQSRPVNGGAVWTDLEPDALMAPYSDAPRSRGRPSSGGRGRARSWATATSTGRPQTPASSATKPSKKSSYSPVGSPSLKIRRTTL